MKTEPIRITTAQASPAEDRRRRQRNYLASMSLRSVCFVTAVLTAMAGIDWLWPYLIGAAIVLPYFAVVAANSVTGREAPFAIEVPARELEGTGRRAL